MELPTNVIINREGIYCSKDQNICLEIDVSKNVVTYKLKDTVNFVRFLSGNPAISNTHTWGILVDDNGMVWVQSSDIGLFVLNKNERGNYSIKPFGVVNEDNIKSIPEEILNIFPQSLKSKFSE